MFKKFMSLVLVVAMVFALNTVPASAKKTMKIVSGKSIKLELGKTFKVKVNVKGAKFKSTNKKVATVTKKGKVTAKKAGKCKIVVTKGKAKAISKITVGYGKVKNVNAYLYGETTAKIEFDAVKGAKKYNVYKSLTEKGKYTKATTTDLTNATVENLELGKVYYFKVKATDGKNESFKYSDVASVKTYKKVWSEEFEDKEINTDVWNFDTDNNNWGSSESISYEKTDYYKLEDGCLVITPTMKYDKANETLLGTAYSTRLNTSGKKNMQYGKVEIRAKAAAGQGAWSSGFMLGEINESSNKWPYNGEIDVLDVYDGNVLQTIHCGYYNNQNWSHGNMAFDTKYVQKQMSDEFHVYGIIWNEDYIQFTVDGNPIGKYAPKETTDYKLSQENANEMWDGVFMNNPFYFVLNCGISRKVTTDGWTLIDEKENIQTYQSYFNVDYIRVYE